MTDEEWFELDSNIVEIEGHNDDPFWVESGPIYEAMEAEFREELDAAMPTLLRIAAARQHLTLDADGIYFCLAADGSWSRVVEDRTQEPVSVDRLVSWSTSVDLVEPVRRAVGMYAGVLLEAVVETGPIKDRRVLS